MKNETVDFAANPVFSRVFAIVDNVDNKMQTIYGNLPDIARIWLIP